MITTRKEAEAYEKLARAKQKSAEVKGKLYDALLDKLAPRSQRTKNPSPSHKSAKR